MKEMVNHKGIPQVLYLGRWVPRDYFRAFVYNEKTAKLVNSYEDYVALIGSGQWFATKEEVTIPLPETNHADDIALLTETSGVKDSTDLTNSTEPKKPKNKRSSRKINGTNG